MIHIKVEYDPEKIVQFQMGILKFTAKKLLSMKSLLYLLRFSGQSQNMNFWKVL